MIIFFFMTSVMASKIEKASENVNVNALEKPVFTQRAIGCTNHGIMEFVTNNRSVSDLALRAQSRKLAGGRCGKAYSSGQRVIFIPAACKVAHKA